MEKIISSQTDTLLLQKTVQEVAYDVFLAVERICERNQIRYYLAEGTLLGAVRHKGFIPWDDDIDMVISISDMSRFVSCCKRELPSHLYVEGAFDKNRQTIYERGITKVYHKYYKTIDNSGRKRNLSIDVMALIGMPDGKLAQTFHFNKLRLRKALPKVCRPDGIATRYWKNQSIIRKIVIKLAQTFDFNRLISYEKQYEILEKEVNKYSPETSKYVMVYPSAYGIKEMVKREYYGGGIAGIFVNSEVILPQHYHEILTNLYGDYMTPPPEEKRVGSHLQALIIDDSIEE